IFHARHSPQRRHVFDAGPQAGDGELPRGAAGRCAIQLGRRTGLRHAGTLQPARQDHPRPASGRRELKIPMSQSIPGRVALITGAARGQGRAHAVRLSAEGADIIALDIAGPLPSSVPYDSPTPDDLAETAQLVQANGTRVITAAVDIRDIEALTEAVDRAVGELGRLDIIVANAGICSPAPWDQITPQAFRDTIDTNVVGTWNTVMAGAHHIIDGGRGGSIILIGSAAGIKMQSFMIHYTASKHAIVGMARAFAAELGRHNIRVNS